MNNKLSITITNPNTPAPVSFRNDSGPIEYNMTNDYMFRAVLQRSSPTLKKLIASLLHIPPGTILSVKITNPIQLGECIDNKTFFLDIKVLLNNYTHINLEMQVINEHNWTDRSLLYLCRSFDNLEKGEDYSNVRPAIHIGFLNFTPFPEVPEFYATHQMMNIKNHHIFNDKFTLSVVDLTQIHLATEEDRSYHIDYWASLFKATTWEEIQMLAYQYPDINDTAETLYELNSEEYIRLQCQARADFEAFESMRENARKQAEAERDEAIAEKEAALADIADKDAIIADKDAVIADKDAVIADKDAALADKNAALASQNALIQQLYAQIAKSQKQ